MDKHTTPTQPASPSLRERLLRSAGELRGDNAKELIALLREAAAALSPPALEGMDAEVADVLAVLDGWGLTLRDRVGKKPAMHLSDVVALIRKLAAPAPAQQAVTDGDLHGVSAERREDMSPRGRLRLSAQDDGDMCLLVIEDDGTSAGIEFCNSGGHSRHTLQALRNLSRAMQADNEEEPSGNPALAPNAAKAGDTPADMQGAGNV